jgi:ribonucleoside-diphosphate reductase alpha chain
MSNLPKKRDGYTYEFVIHSAELGRLKVYIRTGFDSDGSIREIFIDAAKLGSSVRGFIGSLAMSISLGLQSGTPHDSYMKMFRYQQFEPCGRVDSPEGINITECSSVSDLVAQLLEVEGIKDDRPISYATEKPKEAIPEVVLSADIKGDVVMGQKPWWRLW